MGTTGTGRPHDYNPVEPGNRCDEALPAIALDDVGTAPYWRRANAVPPAGTPLRVRGGLVGGRLAVAATNLDEVIGFLPTEFNFLRACIAQGYSYSGAVLMSRERPVPTVRVQLTGRR